MCSAFMNDNQVTLACNTEKDQHVYLILRTAGNSYMHVVYMYTKLHPQIQEKGFPDLPGQKK